MTRCIESIPTVGFAILSYDLFLMILLNLLNALLGIIDTGISGTTYQQLTLAKS